jgi:hypothetical protein
MVRQLGSEKTEKCPFWTVDRSTGQAGKIND